MAGPSRGTEMAADGLSRALRKMQGDRTQVAMRNELIEKTGASDQAAKNWFKGESPCEMGNLFALVELYGAPFLTEVFAEGLIGVVVNDASELLGVVTQLDLVDFLTVDVESRRQR